jgi:hypothetical protein
VNVAKVLPLAFVMIAGPQILSAIFLATSEKWRRNSAAYLLGSALSISVVVTISYLAIHGASDEGTSHHTIDVVVLVLLVAAALHVFMSRKTAEPPSWMGRLQTAAPRLSFKLGLLLLGVFPTDILTSAAVGSYLASHGDPLWHFLPFLALTLFLLALPSLLIICLGRRGEDLVPRARDWMNENSWVISEVVIVFFMLIVANDLAK